MAVVLGVVIEIVVVGNYLYHRKGLDSGPVKIHGAGQFPAGDALFHQYGIAFRKCEADGVGKGGSLGNLGYAEAGTSVGGFYEQGQAQACDSPVGKSVNVFAILPDECGRGEPDSFHLSHVPLAGILVEGDRRYIGAAPRERYSQHFQVSLDLARLAGNAVLHYVGIVKLDLAAQHGDGEIRLVDLGTGPLREGHPHGIAAAHGHQLPLPEPCENLIHVVDAPVYTGRREFPAPARYLPFRGIAAVNHRNCLEP